LDTWTAEVLALDPCASAAASDGDDPEPHSEPEKPAERY
jgi:hypothetical protein